MCPMLGTSNGEPITAQPELSHSPPLILSCHRHMTGPILIKFRRLVQNDDVDCGDVWKWKPDVEFQYGGRLGEFSSMSSQSHVSHCSVLPLGEFTVTIPHATLQGAVT